MYTLVSFGLIMYDASITFSTTWTLLHTYTLCPFPIGAGKDNSPPPAMIRTRIHICIPANCQLRILTFFNDTFWANMVDYGVNPLLRGDPCKFALN